MAGNDMTDATLDALLEAVRELALIEAARSPNLVASGYHGDGSQILYCPECAQQICTPHKKRCPRYRIDAVVEKLDALISQRKGKE
jgi:hypothetical protein